MSTKKAVTRKAKKHSKDTRVEINWDGVDRLIKFGYNAQEICDKFKIGYQTINKRSKEQHGVTIGEYIRKAKTDVASEFEAVGRNGKSKWDEVYQFIEAQCTGAEIAANYDLDPDVFYGVFKTYHGITFKEFKARKRRKGKLLLRTKQFSIAMSGDKNMLTHLGKQYLDQREKMEQKVDANVTMKARVLSPDEIGDYIKELKNSI